MYQNIISLIQIIYVLTYLFRYPFKILKLKCLLCYFSDSVFNPIVKCSQDCVCILENIFYVLLLQESKTILWQNMAKFIYFGSPKNIICFYYCGGGQVRIFFVKREGSARKYKGMADAKRNPSYSSDLHFSVLHYRPDRGTLTCSKICSIKL